MDEWKIITGTASLRTRCGKTPQYAEGLYDLGKRVYAWMVPNGSWGESNAGLVVGEGESLLVDTLWDLNFTREMLQAMEPIVGGAPIRYLANTHGDGDHIWGNGLVKDAEIIMTTTCNREVLEMTPAMMTMGGKIGKTLAGLRIGKAKKIGEYFQNMLAPYDFREIEVLAATRTFEGEMALEIGGREVHLIEVGPAHTRGDMMVYVPGAKTLFGGDILFAGCTPVFWAGPVENYISALERILGMDVNVIIPGHGPISDKDAVVEEKGYLEYLQHEVGRRFESGMPAKEAAYDIALSDDFSRRAFSSWGSPERIMTNTYVIYRHLLRRTGHLKIAEKLNILCKQALLAYEMRDASAATMQGSQRCIVASK